MCVCVFGCIGVCVFACMYYCIYLYTCIIESLLVCNKLAIVAHYGPTKYIYIYIYIYILQYFCLHLEVAEISNLGLGY